MYTFKPYYNIYNIYNIYNKNFRTQEEGREGVLSLYLVTVTMLPKQHTVKR